MKEGEGQVVCVTGASGFVASWVVKLLLDDGYSVHATVRNLGDPKKVEHLKKLEGAKDRLKLFEADLMVEGSFTAAIEGCNGVFHVASPVIFNNIKDPQKELLEPAMNGTLDVLQSCLKYPTIKRVVLTSSIAAVSVSERVAANNDGIIDETWYSDPVYCEENEAWYCLSKTLAEEAAWKFSKKHGIDLVTINPGFIIGNCLHPTSHFTLEDFVVLLKEGKSATLPFHGLATLVDVKDVARAHILAFKNPLANGRYLMAAATLTIPQIFNILRNLYPTLSLAKIDEENTSSSNRTLLSRERAESLGIKFIPVEESLKETIELLKERNLIAFE